MNVRERRLFTGPLNIHEHACMRHVLVFYSPSETRWWKPPLRASLDCRIVILRCWCWRRLAAVAAAARLAPTSSPLLGLCICIIHSAVEDGGRHTMVTPVYAWPWLVLRRNPPPSALPHCRPDGLAQPAGRSPGPLQKSPSSLGDKLAIGASKCVTVVGCGLNGQPRAKPCRVDRVADISDTPRNLPSLLPPPHSALGGHSSFPTPGPAIYIWSVLAAVAPVDSHDAVMQRMVNPSCYSAVPSYKVSRHQRHSRRRDVAAASVAFPSRTAFAAHELFIFQRHVTANVWHNLCRRRWFVTLVKAMYSEQSARLIASREIWTNLQLFHFRNAVIW